MMHLTDVEFFLSELRQGTMRMLASASRADFSSPMRSGHVSASSEDFNDL